MISSNVVRITSSSSCFPIAKINLNDRHCCLLPTGKTEPKKNYVFCLSVDNYMQMKRKGAWRAILPGVECLVEIRGGEQVIREPLAAGNFEGPKNLTRGDAIRADGERRSRLRALY